MDDLLTALLAERNAGEWWTRRTHEHQNPHATPSPAARRHYPSTAALAEGDLTRQDRERHVTQLVLPLFASGSHEPTWENEDIGPANQLLIRAHYLGPMQAARAVYLARAASGDVLGAMIWRRPTSRRLPLHWLELSRWCLTPGLGPNGGSKAHAAVVRLLRRDFPEVTTLVSYSDPSVGHTGALYRACNWVWCPTWHRLRPPPTGNGDWGDRRQAVKDRWIFALRHDPDRADLLRVGDPGAIRHFVKTATDIERAWAKRSLSPDLREAA